MGYTNTGSGQYIGGIYKYRFRTVLDFKKRYRYFLDLSHVYKEKNNFWPGMFIFENNFFPQMLLSFCYVFFSLILGK